MKKLIVLILIILSPCMYFLGRNHQTKLNINNSNDPSIASLPSKHLEDYGTLPKTSCNYYSWTTSADGNNSQIEGQITNITETNLWYVYTIGPNQDTGRSAYFRIEPDARTVYPVKHDFKVGDCVKITFNNGFVISPQ